MAAEAVKVLARTHKTLIWELTAVVLRLRAQLLEYFPAAVAAFEDLDAPDTLELLGKAPEPARAAKLTRAQVSAVLKRPAATRSRSGPTRSWPLCAARDECSPAGGHQPTSLPKRNPLTLISRIPLHSGVFGALLQNSVSSATTTRVGSPRLSSTYPRRSSRTPAVSQR